MKRIVVAVLMAIGLVTAMWWGARDQAPLAAPAREPSADLQPLDAGGAPVGDELVEKTLAQGKTPRTKVAPEPASTPPSPALPLPPIDTPLATVLDDLVARARAGDARAACRIAIDLSQCASLPIEQRMRAWTETSLTSDAARPRGDGESAERERERGIDSVARALEREARTGAMCDGIEPAQLETAPLWMLRAAQLGHSGVAAIALNQRLQGSLDAQRRLLDAYATAAPGLIEREVGRGNVEVMRALAMAHGDPSAAFNAGLLQGLVGYDAQKSYAYARAVERAGAARRGTERARAILRDSLSPAQLAAAELESDALFVRAFGGRALAPDDARMPAVGYPRTSELCGPAG